MFDDINLNVISDKSEAFIQMEGKRFLHISIQLILVVSFTLIT